MDDREVAELIDRIVRESKIPSARARQDLRRELESHFADAGRTSEALRAAIDRFGNPTLVSDALERTHRRGPFLTHLARILAAAGASTVVALVMQLIVNLPFDARANLVSLGPGFVRSIAFSAMIVVALVAAWELDIDALCMRLERDPLRLVLTVVGLSATMLLFHAAENTPLAPGRALAAGAVAVVIWTCTIAILACTDRAFARVFTPSDR